MSVDPVIAALALAGGALLFAAAAVHKFRDLRRFEEIFTAYGLPVPGGAPIARAVPVLEGLVAVGLLFDDSRVAAAGTAIVLLLAYAAAIALNLRRGRRDLACGCGGPDDRRPIAGWMVGRNLLIAAALGALVLPSSPRALEPTDLLTIGFGTAACALVYLCLDRLLSNSDRAGFGAQR
jgi:hypothetical protein